MTRCTGSDLAGQKYKLGRMCIRYSKDIDQLVRWSEEIKAWIPASDWTRGLDTFPGYQAPIVVPDSEHGRALISAQWGFTPLWSDPSYGKRSGYNARSETLTQKPTWRDAIKNARCIVPASGFYERDNKRWLKFGTGYVMPLAGLYSNPNRHCSTVSYAMVTTEPNNVVEEHHDRMPVILKPEDMDRWLDPKSPVEECLAMLEPYVGDDLHVSDVGPIIKRGDLPSSVDRLVQDGHSVTEIVEGVWTVDGNECSPEQLVELARELGA